VILHGGLRVEHIHRFMRVGVAPAHGLHRLGEGNTATLVLLIGR